VRFFTLRIGRRVLGLERVDQLDRGLALGRDQRGQVGVLDLLLLRPQLRGGHANRLGQLLTAGRTTVRARERLARLLEVTLEPAQRTRRPVAPAQLIEHRAVDAGPEVGLESRTLGGVVASMAGMSDSIPHEIRSLHLAQRGQLAQLLVDDVLDQRNIGQDQAIPERDVATGLVLLPDGERLIRGGPCGCRFSSVGAS